MFPLTKNNSSPRIFIPWEISQCFVFIPIWNKCQFPNVGISRGTEFLHVANSRHYAALYVSRCLTLQDLTLLTFDVFISLFLSLSPALPHFSVLISARWGRLAALRWPQRPVCTHRPQTWDSSLFLSHAEAGSLLLCPLFGHLHPYVSAKAVKNATTSEWTHLPALCTDACGTQETQTVGKSGPPMYTLIRVPTAHAM